MPIMTESPAIIDEITSFAATLTDLTRSIIHHHFRQQPIIKQKQDKSPVTVADERVERALRRAILSRYPDHSIIGEEEAQHHGDAIFTWVIDPIDGTRAFSTGNPLFGTLIGILEHGQPKIGVIDLPALEQRWIGQMGKGSWCNSDPCSTAQTHQLAEARITTTSSTLLGETGLPRFERLAEACRVVNYGGDCANYAHLASGWCDLVVEANLNAYDIMAVVPVITAAGGIVTQWDGKAITLDHFDGTILAAATTELHTAAITKLA
jgi:histidinol phosphatase-like enzyme (inositol monophosphatase family)